MDPIETLEAQLKQLKLSPPDSNDDAHEGYCYDVAQLEVRIQKLKQGATVTDREKKCEELIDDRLAGRLEDLLPDWDDNTVVCDLADELGVQVDPVPVDATSDEVEDARNELRYDVRDKHRDRVLEGVLSVDVRKSYRVLLSYGGPSDGFDFVFDKDGDLVECYYFYQDWFDGAKRSVDMEKAQELVQLYYVGPEFE